MSELKKVIQWIKDKEIESVSVNLTYSINITEPANDGFYNEIELDDVKEIADDVSPTLYMKEELQEIINHNLTASVFIESIVSEDEEEFDLVDNDIKMLNGLKKYCDENDVELIITLKTNLYVEK